MVEHWDWTQWLFLPSTCVVCMTYPWGWGHKNLLSVSVLDFEIIILVGHRLKVLKKVFASSTLFSSDDMSQSSVECGVDWTVDRWRNYVFLSDWSSGCKIAEGNFTAWRWPPGPEVAMHPSGVRDLTCSGWWRPAPPPQTYTYDDGNRFLW